MVNGPRIARAGAALTDLTANRNQGLAAEARVGAQLVEEGSKILGSHVSIRTSAGRRVVDHLIQRADGSMAAVEVKSGNAVRSGQQVLKDLLIETEGGVLTGKNAPAALRGKQVQIPTEVRRPPT
jgi:hypothetical protein